MLPKNSAVFQNEIVPSNSVYTENVRIRHGSLHVDPKLRVVQKPAVPLLVASIRRLRKLPVRVKWFPWSNLFLSRRDMSTGMRLRLSVQYDLMLVVCNEYFSL